MVDMEVIANCGESKVEELLEYKKMEIAIQTMLSRNQ